MEILIAKYYIFLWLMAIITSCSTSSNINNEKKGRWRRITSPPPTQHRQWDDSVYPFDFNNIINEFMADSDVQLILDLDLIRQLWQYSPEQAREAIVANDRAFWDRLMAFLKDIANHADISLPCVADLTYYVYSAVRLIEAQVKTGQCFNETYCDTGCLQDNGPNILKRQWVIDVIDAFGKFGTGVISGNILFHGSFDTCMNINVVKNNQGQKWRGKYCQANLYPGGNPFAAFVSSGSSAAAASSCSMDHNQSTTTTTLSTTTEASTPAERQCFTLLPILSYGTCMPESCTNYDVSKFINLMRPVQSAANIDLVCKIDVKCQEHERYIQDDPASLIVLSFVIIIGAFVIFGTGYDYFSYQPAIRSHAEADAALEADYYASQSWFTKVLLAFSAYTNMHAIIKTEKRGGQIECLHGMRVLSMFWIMIGHTYYYAATSATMVQCCSLDNIVSAVFNFPHYLLNQILLNAPLAVDTFFFLSGLLVTFLWMKMTQKMKAANITSGGFWFNFYFHRYLRLTPVYMVILAFHITLFEYIGSGPFWRPINPSRCVDTWYLNALYVNNLIGASSTNTCVGWSWYLANDMQFYVVSPIYLVLLWKYQYIGIAANVVTLIAAGITHCIIIYRNDYPPTPLVTAKVDIILKIQQYWPDVYVKPWIRCSPYIVGVLVGYALWKCKLNIKLKWYWVALGWTTSTVVGLLTVFGLYDYSKTGNLSEFVKYLYAFGGRPAYAASLGWLVFACSTGYGGPIEKVLGWKVWMPLSRLTYCAYLIHPVLIQAFWLSRPVPFHFGHHYEALIHFFALIVASYSISMAVSCLFELPVSHVETIVKSMGGGASGRRPRAQSSKTNRDRTVTMQKLTAGHQQQHGNTNGTPGPIDSRLISSDSNLARAKHLAIQ